jgi:hypothetical protein
LRVEPEDVGNPKRGSARATMAQRIRESRLLETVEGEESVGPEEKE